MLNHAYNECTGNWRLVGTGATRQVRCDHCDVQYPATPENRLAAIDENYAGIYLCHACKRAVALDLEDKYA